jgi:hypothetical protein
MDSVVEVNVKCSQDLVNDLRRGLGPGDLGDPPISEMIRRFSASTSGVTKPGERRDLRSGTEWWCREVSTSIMRANRQLSRLCTVSAPRVLRTVRVARCSLTTSVDAPSGPVGLPSSASPDS